MTIFNGTIFPLVYMSIIFNLPAFLIQQLILAAASLLICGKATEKKKR